MPSHDVFFAFAASIRLGYTHIGLPRECYAATATKHCNCSAGTSRGGTGLLGHTGMNIPSFLLEQSDYSQCMSWDSVAGLSAGDKVA
jgi:hypothetical protein